MAKNSPQRERPALRVHGKYAAAGKASFMYPAWVTERRPPPERIQVELEAARAVNR